jgi:multidrug resistance protein, MATE family
MIAVMARPEGIHHLHHEALRANVAASQAPISSPEGEEIPLLLKSRRVASRSALALEVQDDLDVSFWWAHLHEARRLAGLAIPLVCSAMSGFLVSMVSVAFVGRHIGSFELSVAVLATSIFNVTGLSFIVGSLGALETLAGQAYGSGAFPALGLALQRGALITLSLCAIIMILWLHVEGLLIFLGQEAALASAAATFVRWSSPSLLFVSASECLKRFLMAQNIVAPAAWSAGLSLIAAVAANYVLVVLLNFGLRGAAVAAVCAQLAPLLLLLFWARRREASLAASHSPQQSWHGWSKEAFAPRYLLQYARLAVPSAAMVIMEWWTFEACVVMSGWLPDPQVNVALMGLTLNISGAFYMLPLGMGSATSVRVGNALGAGLARGAQRAARTAIAAVMVTQCCLASIILAYREKAALVFTDDKAVAAAAAPVMVVMAICMFGDGINAVLGGTLRGAGRQEIGAIANLSAFWLLGLPLAGFLAFQKDLGVKGLWMGLATAASFNVSTTETPVAPRASVCICLPLGIWNAPICLLA